MCATGSPSIDPLNRLKVVYDDNPQFCAARGRTSEEDTRANILDRLIHEALEWPRPNVRREPFANPGFIDYEFTHGRPMLLLEAKAEGETFVFPHRKQRRRRLKIDGALTTDPLLKAAIEQVQQYCNSTGTRYAVATNGYSFVIFRAIVEGSPWREGQAIIFYDVGDIRDNFTEFWNLLSYEAVADGRLDSAFRLGEIRSRGFYRPIEQIVDADSVYGRNPLTVALQPYIDRFFGDIAKQDAVEILEHCYVYSKPIQIIDDNLKLQINDEAPSWAGAVTQIKGEHDTRGGNIGHDLLSTVSSVHRRRGRVVLLMGGIGSGKSTYCRRFFRVVAPKAILESARVHLLYLDFLGAPDDPVILEAYLWEVLARALREVDAALITRPVLEQLFASDLRIIREVYGSGSPETDGRANETILKLVSDHRRFTEEALRYCAAQGHLPVVVFDNVDQLRFGSQTHVFTAAQRCGNLLGCLALLVLREESYSAALFKRHLTAYTIRPYHLSSPRFVHLIRLRIDFATNDVAQRSKAVEADADAKTYAAIASLFQMLRRSIFGQNKNIIKFVESIAYGNMRLALDLFNRFITSGATNMLKILEVYHRGGYSVPFHEFAKSVILSDYRFYKDSRSVTTGSSI